MTRTSHSIQWMLGLHGSHLPVYSSSSLTHLLERATGGRCMVMALSITQFPIPHCSEYSESPKDVKV